MPPNMPQGLGCVVHRRFSRQKVDLDAAVLDRKVPNLLPLSLDPQGKINAETSETDMSNFIVPIIYWQSVYFHY